MYLYGFRDYSENLPVFLINLIVDEITRQHSDIEHITDTKVINDHWPYDQLLMNLFDLFGPSSKHYPKRTILDVCERSLRVISTVLK